MTTESKPRIKITYATLSADNEDLHAGFEAGLAATRASLGGHYRNYIDGAWRDGDGVFEAHSPIDRDLLLGTFALGPRPTWTPPWRPPEPPNRPGPRPRGVSAWRSSSGRATSSATG
jgi:hypothetical protein